MRLGPIQMVIIGFENDDNFRGDITRELDALKGRGVVKLIDAVVAHKTDDGVLTITTRTDIVAGEEAAYGAALERLLDVAANSTIDEYEAVEDEEAVGIGLGDLRRNLADVKPGRAIAIAIFEHSWAAGLSQAIADAGGRLLTQGILTRDAVMHMGDELEAIADAEASLDAARAVRGAAVLDALIYNAADNAPGADGSESLAQDIQAVDRATSMLSTAVAAEALRTLIVAGVIDDSEVEIALLALIETGLLDPELVEQGLELADAAMAGVADVAAAQATRLA